MTQKTLCVSESNRLTVHERGTGSLIYEECHAQQ